jgi:hypothetical protein
MVFTALIRNRVRRLSPTLKPCRNNPLLRAKVPFLHEVARFRLARRHLLDATPSDAVAVARDICDIQAQVMSGAFLQLWTPQPRHNPDGDCLGALAEAASGQDLADATNHIVPADGFPTYIAALRAGS